MVLAPIFWLMWIIQGTGNANFYYAINLVLSVSQIVFMIDCVSAVLKDDYLDKSDKKVALKEEETQQEQPRLIQ